MSSSELLSRVLLVEPNGLLQKTHLTEDGSYTHSALLRVQSCPQLLLSKGEGASGERMEPKKENIKVMDGVGRGKAAWRSRQECGPALSLVLSVPQTTTSLPPCTTASAAGLFTGQPRRAPQVPGHKQALSLYWLLMEDYRTDICI